MVGVVLSSYVLLALGVLLVVAGVVARRRNRPSGRYLLVAGVVFLLAGAVGLGYFIRAFG